MFLYYVELTWIPGPYEFLALMLIFINSIVELSYPNLHVCRLVTNSIHRRSKATFIHRNNTFFRFLSETVGL